MNVRNVVLVVLLAAASVAAGAQTDIRIAQQYGLGYAPLMLLEKLQLIEKQLPGAKVTWQQFGSGAAINEALIAGRMDFGAMGTGPFLIGWDKGAPWKVTAGLVITDLSMQTNNPNIRSLKDFKPGDKIALPGPGSIQHILLAMAAEKDLGSAKALDNNIVAMAHPDGVDALRGGSIAAHYTALPYIALEMKIPGVRQLVKGSYGFGGQYTFLVVAGTEKFRKENPAGYAAFLAALDEAVKMLQAQPKEAAAVLAPLMKLSVEETLAYLTDADTRYTTDVIGMYRMADFMKKVGYISRSPQSAEEIMWDERMLKEKR